METENLNEKWTSEMYEHNFLGHLKENTYLR